VFVYRLATFGTYEDVFFTENVFKLNLSKRVIDKQNPGRFSLSEKLDMSKYFQIPKSDAEAEPIDKSLFENKDRILDKLMEEGDNGKGPKVLELDLTETFHKDEEETYLTAEDRLAANEEAEREKKLREEGKYFDPRSTYQFQLQEDFSAKMVDSLKASINRFVPTVLLEANRQSLVDPVLGVARQDLPLSAVAEKLPN
jgi:hypothetical protein